MFSQASVILFTAGGGGVSAPVHAGIQNPSWADPPWSDTPLGRHPHEMATAADGTHPTGMHSCSVKV